MVTAETAAVLPVLALLLVFGFWSVSVVAAEVRCGDAARLGVRSAARGDPTGEVRSLAMSAAPAGARVEVQPGGSEVSVEVSARVGSLGGWFPAITVSGHAVAELETAAPG